VFARLRITVSPAITRFPSRPPRCLCPADRRQRRLQSRPSHNRDQHDVRPGRVASSIRRPRRHHLAGRAQADSNSRAFDASPMPITAAGASRLLEQQLRVVPAAKTEQPMRSGKSSATLMALVPIEPSNRVRRHFSSRQNVSQIQIHQGRIEQEAVKQSRIPPMPGKNVPILQPASRLNSDSIKSPTTAATLKITPAPPRARRHPGQVRAASRAKTTLAAVETPPRRESLPGLPRADARDHLFCRSAIHHVSPASLTLSQ